MLTGGSRRYDLYPTKDGRFLAVGAVEDKFWIAFCENAGVPLTASGDDVRAAIIKEPSDIWVERFRAVDACVSLVSTLSEALESDQVKARGLYERKVEGPNGRQLDAVPVPVSEAFRRDATHIPKFRLPRKPEALTLEEPAKNNP
jgi:crotonobetainyl-CoA:carnitine CoA-transferase CaiB-like acyl-CoA transferase